MCGIAGIVGERDEVVVGDMCESLRHRGPDDGGAVHGAHVSLGMRRLSIVDPVGGGQPIENEDGSVCTVFNGEIYNHLSLREALRERGHRFETGADTEVIVHGYEEWGTGVVDRLEGMFAFAVWDRTADRVVLARDRLGIKPLYYAALDDAVVFASELTALLEHPGVGLEVSGEAVRLYWALQYVPAPLSILADVRKLEPATTATISLEDGNMEADRYWSLDESGRSDRSIRGLLESAVERRLMADVPLGAFLSGGLDSTAIVSLMDEVSPEPVRTYSVAFADPDYDESAYARRVAAELGTDHHELTVEWGRTRPFEAIVSRLDEPLADPAIVPTFLLAEHASDDVKIVLTGEGSDELFAGYDYYRTWSTWWNAFGGLPRSVYRASGYLEALAPDGSKAELYLQHLSGYGDQRSALAANKSQHRTLFEFPDDAGEGERPIERIVDDAFASTDYRRNLLRFDRRYWLPDDLLFKVDRMTMANSLEARVPFLDHRLVERVNAVPVADHFDGGTKPVLRNAVRDVVPEYVLEREKHGFDVPLDDWFARPRASVDRVFDESVLADVPFVSPARSLSLLARHRSRSVDASSDLWRVWVYATWYRRNLTPRL